MRHKAENPFLEVNGYTYVPGVPEPPPLAKPPFTLKQIRESIPARCFSRSLLLSFAYLGFDLAICAALFGAATYISHLPKYSAIFAWPVYWVLQGVYMSGVWVIAHECGHHAFSDYQIVDDIVGFILHSSLLVPYFSWKITHGKHHLNAGSLENDEHHIPRTRKQMEEWPTFYTALLESPVYNFLELVFSLVLGWMPGYLIFNLMGPEKYRGKNANHFSPTAEMFSHRQYKLIVISNLGVLVSVAGLAWLSYMYGLLNVVFYYVIPYIVLHSTFVCITLLQHTDTYVPRFRSKEWYWLRGALCTVNRSFGKWYDGALHHINDTHVCHHLFPTMPFYNAVEATNYVSKVVGDYFLKDETPIYRALWRAFYKCKFVEDQGGIVFCKSIRRLKE